MFNKFKKGDIVLKLNDLTWEYGVKNVHKQSYIFWEKEMVVLDDNTVVCACDLVKSSPGLRILAQRNKNLQIEINNLKSDIGNLNKKIVDNYAALNGKIVELQPKPKIKKNK